MHLLIISHTFPPSPHSNAKRPYYLAKGFLDAGWEVDVCTSYLDMPLHAPESVRHPRLRIMRFRDPFSQLKKRTAGNRFLSRVAILACTGLLWPDAYAPWAWKVFREVAKSPRFDALLGFISPASTLLAGSIRPLAKVPLMFDYQESFTPEFRRRGRRSPLQQFLLPRLEKLERDSLHKAARIVFTAETNRRAYIDMGLAPEQRTSHVPYFYDESVFGSKEAAQIEPRFQISYFGSFDWKGHRTPATFLESLKLFLAQVPEARGETRFLFHGPWLGEHNALIDAQGLREVVSIQPGVPYQEYVQKLKASPILLLVVSSAHNLFMPSKIVDYFGARRPIMAFVPRDSEMRRVLEQAGMAEFACDETDANGGAAVLERLWAAYKSGKLCADTDKTRFWSSAIQVPRYVEAANHIVGTARKHL